MTTNLRDASLCVLNLCACQVLVRFYCEKCLIWETWLTAGGAVSIPDPMLSDLQAYAVFTDRRQSVTYSASASASQSTVKLVGRMMVMSNASRFSLETEAGSWPGIVELHNQGAGDIRFDLSFVGSPFSVARLVSAGATDAIDMRMIDMVAVMKGITTQPIQITDWASEITITTTFVHGEEMPVVNISGHEYPQ